MTCASCGTATAHIDRLCDDCLAGSVRQECAAQGVPEVVDDPETLRRLARITLRDDERVAS